MNGTREETQEREWGKESESWLEFTFAPRGFAALSRVLSRLPINSLLTGYYKLANLYITLGNKEQQGNP